MHQRPESGLLEMLVGSKSIADAVRLHNDKGHAVRKAPFLIGALRIELHRLLKQVAQTCFLGLRLLAWRRSVLPAGAGLGKLPAGRGCGSPHTILKAADLKNRSALPVAFEQFREDLLVNGHAQCSIHAHLFQGIDFLVGGDAPCGSDG